MPQRRGVYNCVAGVEPNNPPATGSRIRQAVVEECAIVFSDRQHSIQHCNRMNKDRGVKEHILLGSRCCVQQPPVIRSRIGQAVVEFSAIESSITIVERALKEGLADL